MLQGLTYALFQIAENPEYARLLREEAQSVLEEEGGVWTKEAIAKLRRADSLLKEVQRLSGGNASESECFLGGLTLHSCKRSFTFP